MTATHNYAPNPFLQPAYVDLYQHHLHRFPPFTLLTSDDESSSVRYRTMTSLYPNQPKGSLCPRCMQVDLRALFSTASHWQSSEPDDDASVASSTPSESAFYLGDISSVLARSQTCGVCKVVVEAVSSCFPYYGPGGLERLMGRLEGETGVWVWSYPFVDTGVGGGRTVRVGLSTLCPPAMLDHGDEEGGEEGSEGRGRYRIGRRYHAGDIQLMRESAKQIGLAEGYYGRALRHEKVDMRLAKEWLRDCEVLHSELCSKPGLDRGKEVFDVRLPKKVMVVDIDRGCLVMLPAGARYIALSYCWPSKGGAFVTTQANKNELMIVGAISAEEDGGVPISDTIRDAISCTRDLGEQYLWVDSLCIVQDDQGNKHTQMAQMDLIYGNAVLTIVAAHDTNTVTASGLPGYRSESSSMRHQKRFTVQGLDISIPLPCLEDLLSNTRWDTRGWTFQETMLSRRLLYFTSSQAYFQCSCAIYCEDTFSPSSFSSSSTTTATSSYNLPCVQAPHKPSTINIAISTNLWNPKNLYATPTTDIKYGELSISHTPYTSPSAALSAYNTFVSYYLRRQLSYPEDILNALAGLLHVFQRTMNTKFWAGLPGRWIDHALLWELASEGKRRLGFPSWSWAGWDGMAETSYWLMLDDVRGLVEWYVSSGGMVERVSHAGELGCDEYLQVQSIDDDDKMKEICLRSASRFGKDGMGSAAVRDWGGKMVFLAAETGIRSFHLSALEHCLPDPEEDLWPTGMHLKILDDNGVWIGLILVDKGWVKENLDMTNEREGGSGRFDFVLLSEGKRARAEHTAAFDTEVFMSEKGSWHLLNVMLVEWDGEYARRVAVGSVHKEAWKRKIPRRSVVRFI